MGLRIAGSSEVGKIFQSYPEFKPHVDQSLETGCLRKGQDFWLGQLTSAEAIPGGGW